MSAPDPIHHHGSLPGVLGVIAERASPALAVMFAKRFGGTRVYVPQATSIDEGHAWAVAFGQDGARAIATALDEEAQLLNVPLGGAGARALQQRLIVAMTAENKSADTIAAALRVDRRTVERHRARLRLKRVGARHPDLFD